MVEIPNSEVEDLLRIMARLRNRLEAALATKAGPPVPKIVLPPGFTVGQRILVHLEKSGGADSRITELTAPRALTQEPIGEAAGISRAHAALELKRLIDRGLVESPGKRHPVPNGVVRVVYVLTPQGHTVAKEIRAAAKV